jgi:hypothetical protein
MTEDKVITTSQNDKCTISDSIVIIESYIALAQNYIENNEEIEGLTPLYMAIEKIEEQVQNIKQLYENI